MDKIKVEDLKVYFHSERIREDGVKGLAFKIAIFPVPDEPDIKDIANRLGDKIIGIELE